MRINNELLNKIELSFDKYKEAVLNKDDTDMSNQYGEMILNMCKALREGTSREEIEFLLDEDFDLEELKFINIHEHYISELYQELGQQLPLDKLSKIEDPYTDEEYKVVEEVLEKAPDAIARIWIFEYGKHGDKIVFENIDTIMLAREIYDNSRINWMKHARQRIVQSKKKPTLYS